MASAFPSAARRPPCPFLLSVATLHRFLLGCLDPRTRLPSSHSPQYLLCEEEPEPGPQQQDPRDERQLHGLERAGRQEFLGKGSGPQACADPVERKDHGNRLEPCRYV